MIGKSSSGWTSSVATERGDLRGYRVNLQRLYLHCRRRSAGGPDETFRIAGTMNPKSTAPCRGPVSIQVINPDPDTACGLVMTGGQGRFRWMPVMTSRLAFSGSALWGPRQPHCCRHPRPAGTTAWWSRGWWQQPAQVLAVALQLPSPPDDC
jgi:hypothetical protein